MKLDAALELLYLNKDKTAMTLKEIHKKMPFKISEEEVKMIVDKFRADKLLAENNITASEFFLSYEGVKFYQCGGYLRDTLRQYIKNGIKIMLIALGVVSTVIGIIIGLMELL